MRSAFSAGLLLATVLLVGCGTQAVPSTGSGAPIAGSGGAQQDGRREIPGTAWTIACISYPNAPVEQRRSCRAELDFGAPGSPVQASVYTITGGARWLLRSNVPAQAFGMQVVGSGNAYAAPCNAAGNVCILAEGLGPRLTQEMMSGQRVAMTLATAQHGRMRSEVALNGIQEALRTSLAGTSPGVLAPVGLRPSSGSILSP